MLAVFGKVILGKVADADGADFPREAYAEVMAVIVVVWPVGVVRDGYAEV